MNSRVVVKDYINSNKEFTSENLLNQKRENEV
jgi:hypothetical protein